LFFNAGVYYICCCYLDLIAVEEEPLSREEEL
jgi:hypothetical protein